MVGWLDEVISSYFEAVVYQQEFELYEEDTDYYWCLSNKSVNATLESWISLSNRL